MKFTNKDVEGIIKEVIGKDILPLVKLIRGKKNVSEFKIADKLKLTINQVRNILYRLQEYSLITFTRKKDKKKGWYIYYWTFNEKEARNLIVESKKKRLNELMDKLAREHSEIHFICRNNCLRIRYEDALEYNFKCPECGELIYEENNKLVIENIKNEIMNLERELGVKA